MTRISSRTAYGSGSRSRHVHEAQAPGRHADRAGPRLAVRPPGGRTGRAHRATPQRPLPRRRAARQARPIQGPERAQAGAADARRGRADLRADRAVGQRAPGAARPRDVRAGRLRGPRAWAGAAGQDPRRRRNRHPLRAAGRSDHEPRGRVLPGRAAPEPDHRRAQAAPGQRGCHPAAEHPARPCPARAGGVVGARTGPACRAQPVLPDRRAVSAD